MNSPPPNPPNPNEQFVSPYGDDGATHRLVTQCGMNATSNAQDELDKLYAEVKKAVDDSGTAIGNEHETYSLQQRIRNIIAQRDYYQRQTDEARQRIACARGLLAPLGNQAVPSVLTIREALNILR